MGLQQNKAKLAAVDEADRIDDAQRYLRMAQQSRSPQLRALLGQSIDRCLRTPGYASRGLRELRTFSATYQVEG
jgi:hypothetical protein